MWKVGGGGLSHVASCALWFPLAPPLKDRPGVLFLFAHKQLLWCLKLPMTGPPHPG